MSIENTVLPEKSSIKSGPMLNTYPDSIGGTLSDVVLFLKRPELQNVFQSCYILPSVFNPYFLIAFVCRIVD